MVHFTIVIKRWKTELEDHKQGIILQTFNWKKSQALRKKLVLGKLYKQWSKISFTVEKHLNYTITRKWRSRRFAIQRIFKGYLLLAAHFPGECTNTKLPQRGRELLGLLLFKGGRKKINNKTTPHIFEPLHKTEPISIATSRAQY